MSDLIDPTESGRTVAERFRRSADALTQALDQIGHPLPSMLQPGLSDDQIDDLVRPTGLELPNEMRALWKWANGVAAIHVDGPLGAHMFPGGLEMLDLAASVSLYLESLEEFPWSETPDSLLSRSWLIAFISGQNDYWLDTSVDAIDSCPVRRIYRSDMWTEEMLAQQTVGSLADAFNDMRQLIVDEAWTVIDVDAPAASSQNRLLFWGTPNDTQLPKWMQ